MKKIVIFTIIAAMSQMFCGNVFGQQPTSGNNPTYNTYGSWQIHGQQLLLHPKTITSPGGIVEGGLRIDANGAGTGKSVIEMWGGEGQTALGFSVLGESGVAGSGGIALRMSNGRDYGFQMYFPRANDRWNRIIAATGASLSFSTGDRGVLNDLTDLFINPAGNVGIGTSSTYEKLTIAGNLKLEGSNRKIIGSEGLEISANNNQPISFRVGTTGLQIKKGRNDDVTLYLPHSASGYTKWNRIIAKNHLSFSTGDRGITDDLVDLFIGMSGNVGIGISNPAEKLTIAGGNIRLNNGKLFINSNPDSINTVIKEKFSAFITGGVVSEDYAIAPKDTWADHVLNTDYQLQSLNEVENYILENKHLPDIPSAAEVKENGYTLHDMNVKLLQKVEELTLYSIEQNKEIEQLKKVVSSYQSLLEKVEKLENKINK